jgi:Flp pilus assembly protein TadD
MTIMKKLGSALLFLLLFVVARADEGMWIPSLLKSLNEGDLKTRGLVIPVEEIWSVDQPSIKDAIVHFGGGCTAEVISYEGLILTNHHCGYSQIQSHSSVQNDYLKHGFWAMDHSQELTNPGLTATFIVRMEDVTDQVLAGNPTDVQIRKTSDKIKADAVKGTHYEAFVRPFNYGNSYFLIVTETFKDVRLVGAPPSSIGKFGGDTDNWIWPRHTGDFSLFRIYAGKDNKPAEISPENVPYRPKYSLPISLAGVKEGDFTMVFGFPGRTQQFLSAPAVEFIVNKSNPAKIKIRETALNIIDAEMSSSDQLRIMYAAKQARISNAYKKWIGETRGLKKLNAVAIKKAMEEEYVSRAEKDPEYATAFGSLPAQFKKKYEEYSNYILANDYFTELIISGPEFIRYTNGYEILVENYKTLVENEKDKEQIQKLRSSVDGYFKDYNPSTDRKLFKAIFPIFVNEIPADLQPDYLKELDKKYKGNWDLLAEEIFTKSIFVNKEKAILLLEKFSASSVKKVQADPAYKLMSGLYDGYREKILDKYRAANTDLDQMMVTFVKGWTKLFPERKYWFDANSTLRLSYGKAEGSAPHDGMKYTYFTTLGGMIDKYIPGDEEFDLPPKLIELYNNKDYGPYGSNGEMRFCFTASNHTTGGNSGSPVLDGNGYLVGTNFDRSWESTMSDIMYDPNICRNIILDVRYTLFIIDKYAGATHLIKEMELMTPENIRKRQDEKRKSKIIQLTESIRTASDPAVFLLERASFYRDLGMRNEALLDVQTVLKNNAKNTNALLMKGELLLDDNRFNDAIKEFDKVLAFEPDNEKAWFGKALTSAELKKYDEAIKYYTKYISYNNRDPKGYYNRGVCYMLINKTVEGCADFMVAERLDGNKESWLRKEICR